MPKRSFPFESGSPLQLKNHVGVAQVEREKHFQLVYAKTQNMLAKGAAAANCKLWSGAAPADCNAAQANKAVFKCAVCRRAQENAVTGTCSFCDKKSCSSCSRQCVLCDGVFCCFCSTINYDEPEERYFCLSCYQS